ncbi:F-box/kelch-repeat protein [Raphanus sativus]|nr:F-box/kelch-repeat protein [Raphanus sativus]
MISDLPRDMAEEVLSKLRITSLRGVRFTCKKWNTISKDRSFTKKYTTAAKQKQRKEFQVVMILNNKIYLMSVNLLNPSIERIGKLVSEVDISNIFHCRGLLLCVTKDRSRLVVCNPFNGQTRWIQPRDSYHIHDRYALGYEKKIKYSQRSHKVLRFVYDYYGKPKGPPVCEFEIFSLNSNSWKVVDFNPDWYIPLFHRGVSLKGNTYWFDEEKLALQEQQEDSFYSVSTLQQRVLDRESGAPAPAHTLNIWISSKVDPNGVSWHKVFLAVDMKPLTGFQFLNRAGSFFVDEKKKVVVVLIGLEGRLAPLVTWLTLLAKMDTSKQSISEILQTEILVGHLCALMFQAR